MKYEKPDLINLDNEIAMGTTRCLPGSLANGQGQPLGCSTGGDANGPAPSCGLGQVAQQSCGNGTVAKAGCNIGSTVT